MATGSTGTARILFVEGGVYASLAFRLRRCGVDVAICLPVSLRASVGVRTRPVATSLCVLSFSVATASHVDTWLHARQAYVTGIQALVRLPLVQRQRDAAAGLKTGGLISGYRGSPIASYDQELWKAQSTLDEAEVRFVPGLNEELAATIVWGSQQVGLYNDSEYDGVFGIWYGKGPGVDRAGDAFKHGNMVGLARRPTDQHAFCCNTMRTPYLPLPAISNL